jgi:hypothetical protein
MAAPQFGQKAFSSETVLPHFSQVFINYLFLCSQSVPDKTVHKASPLPVCKRRLSGRRPAILFLWPRQNGRFGDVRQV